MQRSEWRKQRRAKFIAVGLCGNCGIRPARPKFTCCKACAKTVKDRYYATRPVTVRNRAEIKGQSITEQRATHRTTSKKFAEANRELCRARARESRYAVRREVLAAYGGKCSCCGEHCFEFLQFDHIHGGGKAHRKIAGLGYKFCLWLRRNNFPPIVQVLCSNCNFAKGHYGECPHERERRDSTAIKKIRSTWNTPRPKNAAISKVHKRPGGPAYIM